MGGRLSGRPRAGKKTARSPQGQFIALTKDLLRSTAWQTRPINCARLIDYLMLEHLEHGGAENGRLKAPYTGLEKFGIARRYISGAIKEAEDRGLIAVKRGGPKGRQFREDSLYRLTFMHTNEKEQDGKYEIPIPPTNEWKQYVPETDEDDEEDNPDQK